MNGRDRSRFPYGDDRRLGRPRRTRRPVCVRCDHRRQTRAPPEGWSQTGAAVSLGSQPDLPASDRTDVRGLRARTPRLNRRTHVRGHDRAGGRSGQPVHARRDHRRKPVVRTGTAPSLGRQPDLPDSDRTDVRGWWARRPRLNRRTHVRGHDRTIRRPERPSRARCDHRRQPVVHTGAAPNLGRQPDQPDSDRTDLGGLRARTPRLNRRTHETVQLLAQFR